MRVKISVLALGVCLILGLSLSNALAINNVQYLGKTTWTMTIQHSTTGTPSGTQMQLAGGLSKAGDEFYLFQGCVTPDGDGPFVMSGSGFKSGSMLYFTLSGSQDHETSSSNSNWRDSGVMHVEVDTSKSPWSGKFYDIGQDFDTSTLGGTPKFDQRYTDGDVQLSSSPVPLSPSLVAPNNLLLLQ